MIISNSNTVLAAFVIGGSCGAGDQAGHAQPPAPAKEGLQFASATLADTTFHGASAEAFAFEAAPLGPRTLGEAVRLFVDSSGTLILQGADSSRTVFTPDSSLKMVGKTFSSPGHAAVMIGLVNLRALSGDGSPSSTTPAQSGADLNIETKYDLLLLESPGEAARYFVVVRLGQLPNMLIAEVGPLGGQQLTDQNAHGRVKVVALNSAAE